MNKMQILKMKNKNVYEKYLKLKKIRATVSMWIE